MRKDERFDQRNQAIREEVEKMLKEKFWWAKTKVFDYVGTRYGLHRSTVQQIYYRSVKSYLD